MAKKRSQTRYRDAKSGRFVPKTYAEEHPGTTEKISHPNPGKGGAARGKKK